MACIVNANIVVLVLTEAPFQWRGLEGLGFREAYLEVGFVAGRGQCRDRTRPFKGECVRI